MRDARGARALSIGAVATVVVGWGVAQWPYMLPTSLKVSQAAAPDATLQTVFVVFLLAAVLILPAIGLLYVLDQRGALPEEGLETPVGAS
jgi:cytochrome d ubiquinol oxidase subunit II